MEVIRLPAGEVASPESDCISIQEQGDGRFLLNCSALVTCDEDAEAELGDSAAVIGGDTYRSYDEAEAAGIAWAAEQCVSTLYVSRSAGTAPLPEY